MCVAVLDAPMADGDLMNDATTASVFGVTASEDADAPESNGKTALTDAFRTFLRRCSADREGEELRQD